MNITVHQAWDGFSGWSNNGKDLYFLSARANVWASRLGLVAHGCVALRYPLQQKPWPLSDRLQFPEKPKPRTESQKSDRNTLVDSTQGSTGRTRGCKRNAESGNRFRSNRQTGKASVANKSGQIVAAILTIRRSYTNHRRWARRDYGACR